MNQPPMPPNKSGVNASFDITKTAKVACDKCGGIAFNETIILRKVSAILSENGKGGFLPIGAFTCVKCNHVNSDFIPESIRSNYEEEKTMILGEIKLNK